MNQMLDLIASKDVGFSSGPYESSLKCKGHRTFRLHYIKFNLLRNESQLGKYRITVAVVRNQNKVNSLYEYSSTIGMDEFAELLDGDKIKDDKFKSTNGEEPNVTVV